MKSLFNVMIVMILLGMSAACSNMNKNDNQSETNEQNEPLNDQTEKNDKDAEQGSNDANAEPEPESADDTQDTEKEDEIVLENEAFKIFEPSPDAEVKDRMEVRGLARVFEGTVQYEFEDGHFILDQGYTTASEGAPGWGEFNITIELDDAEEGAYRMVLYEKSAKDGTNVHELIIPVHVNK